SSLSKPNDMYVSLFLFSLSRRPQSPTLFPYTTLFRSDAQFRKLPAEVAVAGVEVDQPQTLHHETEPLHLAHPALHDRLVLALDVDRKSTRLNSSHVKISYAVFCLKKKKKTYASRNYRS